jgi:putative membrane protein
MGTIASAVAWFVEPPLLAVLVCAVLFVLGGRRRAATRATGSVERWRNAAFWAGLASVVVALDSPLDRWADSLFAAHMAQHVILLTVAPPLIVLGAPWSRMWKPLPLGLRRSVARTIALNRRARPLRACARFVMAPAASLVLFSTNLAVWHVPALYDATLRSQAVHDTEHALFLTTGLIVWAQLLDSPPYRSRLGAVMRAAHATAAMLLGWVLAVVLAFAPQPLYHPYVVLAHRPWGLSAIADQQLAAGVMWVPGSLSFTVAIIVFFYRWLGDAPAGTSTRSARPRAPGPVTLDPS